VQCATLPRPQLALALALLLLPSSLHAWAREGHEIIAIIAEPRLQPEVRDAVVALLEGTTFIRAANWADKDRETAPWHYVNIDIMDTEYDAARVCPQDQCVIGQIERFRRELANADGDVRKRQKALKYLIHLVGDLHQPLHAGDNQDRGGNDVQVEFIGETINPYSHQPWNLHAVWDSGILEVRDPDAHHYAERLNAWLKSQPAGAFQDGSVVDWAMESHRIAKDHVYVLPLDLKLGEDYYRANVPVVDQQLAKAGVRLAKLLNEALAKK
jgi:nuclease S1